MRGLNKFESSVEAINGPKKPNNHVGHKTIIIKIINKSNYFQLDTGKKKKINLRRMVGLSI